MSKWILILGILGVLEGQATELFKPLESSWMEVLPENAEKNTEKNPGAYPWWARVLQQEIFKLDPSGEGDAPANPACDPQTLGSKAISSAQYLSELESYFQKCEPQLRTSQRDLISNTWETLFLRLHPSSHPVARHVMFHMPGGVKLKGLLGLKADGKPRPLVILRLGIFSNTEEFFPERYLFMQLFEQSPFHILVLESLSGSEYVKHNSSFALGGFEEGFQNFWIAKKLQDPREPISRIVDSVHLAGVSLGGNGTFFAALLNQLNARPISSFLGFCPLVQFEETFDYHSAQGWSIKAMSFWAKKRLADLQKLYPDLRDSDEYVPILLAHLKLQKTDWPDEYMGIHWPSDYKKKTFSERLHFWPEWKGIESPFLVFATRKDPIVPYEVNSLKLINHDIDVGKSQLKVITLEQGYHCSLPAAYDWKSMSTVLQNYIQQNAKSWQPVQNHWRTRLELKSLAEVHWQVRANGVFLVRSTGWFTQEEDEFPLDALSLYRLEKPLTPEARSMLRRWLNQNIRLAPRDSKNSSPGTDLSWSS